MTAMGKTWHPEHFVCTHCQEEIGSRNFFERDGQPYCEKDYHSLFSPRCYYCNGPILDVSAHMGGAAGPSAPGLSQTGSDRTEPGPGESQQPWCTLGSSSSLLPPNLGFCC